MANTGNTQQIIDYGTSANDGTGDPLRTAFIKTDENFANIWNAGPVGSNITIANNTIQNDSTNGNIVFKPNGIGVVQSNAHILPNTSDVRNLGSADQRWRAAYLGAGGLDLAGPLSAADVNIEGNLAVTGNVTITGNVVEVGNITTDSLRIQLANAATTRADANGAGIVVGANSNIATMTFNGNINNWQFNHGLYINGNITMVGPGSIAANRVAANLFVGTVQASGSEGSVLYIQNGNISGSTMNYTPGSSTLTLKSLFARGANLATGAGAITSGEANYTFLGSDVVIQASANSNTYGQINIQQTQPGTRSSGDYVVTSDNGDDNNHFIDMGIASSNWDGSEINSLGHALFPGDGYLYTKDGNLVIGAQGFGFQKTWKLGLDGNLTVPGNVLPDTTNAYSLGSASRQWKSLYVSNTTIYINNVPIGLTAGNVLTVNGNAVLSNDSNVSVSTTGNVTANYFIGDGSQLTNLPTAPGNLIENGDSNVTIDIPNGNITVSANTETWTFASTGDLTVPGSITTTLSAAIGNIVDNVRTWDSAGANLYVWFDAAATPEIVELNTLSGGNVNGWLVKVDGGNQALITATNPAGFFSISTNQALTGSGTLTFSSPDYEPPTPNPLQIDIGGNVWAFDNTGNLTLPTSGSLIVDGGDGVIGPVSDDMVISWDNEDIRLVSVQGSIEMQADSAFRVQTNYDGGNDLYAGRWEFSNNELVNISDDFGIVSEAGNLTLSGGRDGVNSGNTTISAVDVGVAVYDWTFANNGDLNLPSEGNIVGMTPNNDGRLQWVGNSSGDGNGYTTLNLIPDETLTGTDQYLIIDPTGGSPGHIHIRAGGTQDNSSADLFLGGENSYVKLPAGPDPNVQIAANTHVWTFGSAGAYGELTLPAGEGAIRTNDDTLALVSFNTTTGNANSVYLGSSGGLGFYDQEIGGNWLEIFRSGAEPEIRVPVGRGNLNIQTAEGGNVYNWTFDNTGNLTVPGNISTSGNILAGNVSANVAGFAIGYRDIPQVAFTGNATIAAADAGKHFYSTESTNYVLTIADNSSVSWPVGTAITVVNRGTGNITVAQAAGVSLYLAGNSSAGNRTVSTYGMATVLNVAANVWMINGTGVS